jgi:ribosome biogenesis SPOUT family RNA methylase Rps3
LLCAEYEYFRDMVDTTQRGSGKTYVVEHLDLEMGPWSTLEYKCIAEESQLAGAKFYLCSVPEPLEVPEQLKHLPSLEITNQSAEALFGHQKDRVCLLDPAAAEDLSPQDASTFDVFLFGGILGVSWTPFFRHLPGTC